MNDIDTSRVMTWQYDGAVTFIDLLEAKEDIANDVVRESWNAFRESVFSLSKCGSFGLWLWGNAIGIPRPMFETVVGGQTVTTPISDEGYRRVLMARLYLMNSSPTIRNMTKFYSIILNCGEGSENPRHHVYVSDNLNMTYDVVLDWMTDEETQVILQLPTVGLHPTGVQVNFNIRGDENFIGFDGYYNSSNPDERKGLSVTQKTVWAYYDTVSGRKIVPSGDYYYVHTVGGTQVAEKLEYKPLTNEYYYVSGDDEIICGKPVVEGGQTVYRPISANPSGDGVTFVILAPEVSYWEYTDGVTGKQVIPAGPYYNQAGDELSFDDSKNEYYTTDQQAQRVVYGRWVQSGNTYVNRTIYADDAGHNRVALTGSETGVFYYTDDAAGTKVIVDVPYDGNEPSGHALTRDRSVSGAKWYYEGMAIVGSATAPVKVYGQSLGNFNTANFHPATA